MMMVVMMMILLRGRVKGVIKWEVVMLKMTYLSFFLPSFLSFFIPQTMWGSLRIMFNNVDVVDDDCSHDRCSGCILPFPFQPVPLFLGALSAISLAIRLKQPQVRNWFPTGRISFRGSVVDLRA